MKEGTRVVFYGDRGTVKHVFPEGVIIKFDDESVDFAPTGSDALKIVSVEEPKTYTALEHIVKERDEIQEKYTELLDGLEELLTRHQGNA